MLETAQSDRTQVWDSLDTMIHGWLKERQELILLLCAVDGLREFTPTHVPIKVKLQAFCQVLIDYASAGHFEMYECLMKEADAFGEDGAAIFAQCYPKIQRSTDLAVDFNDQYDHTEQDDETLRKVLAPDMSRLAEALEERFEVEDYLIETMHTAHSVKR